MRNFSLFLKVLAPLPVLVGLFHVLAGLGADSALGARLPAEVLSDPVLDSQNRFYGTVFAGYGALIWLCAADVRRYSAVLRIVGAFIFLGGVARLISAAQYGLPSTPVILLIAIELLGVPLLLGWHVVVLRQSGAAQ